MAIKPFQSDLTPIGHFDFLDTELPNVQGGEIAVFDELPTSVIDQRAPDVFNKEGRTLMRLATGLDTGPFFLAQVEDQKSFVSPGFELTSLYATNKQFGQTVDASGKVGLFGQEGFYSVNSNVVDSLSVNADTQVGARLYPSPLGQLTATPSAAGSIVGFFVEFRDGDVLRSFRNPLEIPGTHPEGDTIIFYKTNADGYINLDFMADIVGTIGTIGTPNDGTYADGYYPFTAATTIADAVDGFNEIIGDFVSGAASVAIGVPADGTYSDGYVSTLTSATRVADAIDELNEAIQEVSNAVPPSTILSSDTVVATDSVDLFEILKYDPTGGTLTISLPDSSALTITRGDSAGIKNASADTTSITVDAPNSTLEDPGSPGTLSASISIAIAGAAHIWQYDGTNWWLT